MIILGILNKSKLYKIKAANIKGNTHRKKQKSLKESLERGLTLEASTRAQASNLCTVRQLCLIYGRQTPMSVSITIISKGVEMSKLSQLQAPGSGGEPHTLTHTLLTSTVHTRVYHAAFTRKSKGLELETV